MSKLPYMVEPCADCPFRKDSKVAWLGSKRMTEILESPSFVCHKTIDGGNSERRQCAGHMIMKGEDNDFVAMAKRLSLDVSLDGQKEIFTTERECIDHHHIS